MSALPAPQPAASPYKELLTQFFPEETSGRTFQLILANDAAGLKEWIATDTEKRVNDVATKMLLHPLHVCAMTGSLECASVLIESGICNINPQDASGATPLHHAAVRNHQAMILYLMQRKAVPLTDRFGGTYVHVLRQIQKPKPESQVFFYKNENGEIVQGNGRDFHKLTGATFLDRDCHVTPEEWLKLWQRGPQEVGLLPPSLQAEYEIYCEKPPLIYLDRHPKTRFNLCAGQDIAPGMVIGEYLGDVKEDAGRIPPGAYTKEQMKQMCKDQDYVFQKVDATDYRGMIPNCNDSFPNTRIFDIYNQKGIPVRHLLVAIQPVRKGESIVFHYGIGHSIRTEPRTELRKKKLIDFFRAECAGGFLEFINKIIQINDASMSKGVLLEGANNQYQQALNYVITTPAAMLTLICENAIQIEELQSIFENPENYSLLKRMIGANFSPTVWAQLDHFYRTTFQHFTKLKALPKRERSEALEKLKKAAETADIDQLVILMGGDPKQFVKQANQEQILDALMRLIKIQSDSKSPDSE